MSNNIEYNINRYVQSKNISSDRANSIRSAIRKLYSYLSVKNVSITEVNINKFESYLRQDLASSSANNYARDVKGYIKFIENKTKEVSSGKVNRSKPATEDELVDIVYSDSMNKYPPRKVYTEYVMKTSSGLNLRCDVYCEPTKTAIECKDGKTHNIVGGVGQCMAYKELGYRPILAIPEVYPDIVSMCKSGGVGLIEVDVITGDIQGHCKPE